MQVMASKLFTVQDFIRYNAPCFNCRSAINFSFIAIAADGQMFDPQFLKPIITRDYIRLILQQTYRKTIQFSIHRKTNRIVSKYMDDVKNWLSKRRMYLNSECLKCLTDLTSHELLFNWNKEYIEAVGINTEELVVDTKTHQYVIINYGENNYSQVFHKKQSERNQCRIDHEFPLMPKSHFKNKQEMIEKCQNIVLLS